MRKIILLGILVLIFAISYSSNTYSTGLNCSIVASGSCTTTPLLYLKNDTNGYLNAHAQLPSNGTYPFAICCDGLSANDTIGTGCDQAVFLRLNQTSNSHVQRHTRNTYANNACINATFGNVTCNYFNSSCAANYTCLASIASSDASDANQTNAHVGDCNQYITKVCCRLNSDPNAPNLTSPANNSDITNRTPNFRWNATDPDNDTLTYDLFIKCYGGCSIDNRDYFGINASNYTLPTELKYFWDDNYWYTWTLRSFDGSFYSVNVTYNFTLSSLVSITLINSTVNFGSLLIGQSNDTTDSLPPPLALQNEGNAFVDVNISADEFLWENKNFASTYYRYKANNYTSENSSFNMSASTTEWSNVPASNVTFLKMFNYSDATDTAAVDILIEVPLDEPPGPKNATLMFTAKYFRVDI